VKAAGGDPEAVKALEYLKPPGLNIAFDDEGHVTSVEQGPGAAPGTAPKMPPGLVNKMADTYMESGNMLDMVGRIRTQLQANPNAATLSGTVQRAAENLRENVTALAGSRSLDAGAQAQLTKLGTMDTSKLETMQAFLAFRLALDLHKGGRVTEQSIRAGQQMVGMGQKLTSAGDILTRLDEVEKTVTAQRRDAGKIIGVKEDQAPGGGGKSGAQMTMTESDVQEAMRQTNKSRDEVLAAAKAKGYTVR
jgi:hypothetical protein